MEINVAELSKSESEATEVPEYKIKLERIPDPKANSMEAAREIPGIKVTVMNVSCKFRLVNCKRTTETNENKTTL